MYKKMKAWTEAWSEATKALLEEYDKQYLKLAVDDHEGWNELNAWYDAQYRAISEGWFTYKNFENWVR